jgi:endonuclease/exonuclease/phosphatase family metal-dependent hydrolase
VLTWNVGEVYWPWQGNMLKDRDVGVVAAALDELDPDLVLLQELASPAQLAALTAGSPWVGALPSCCGYDRHVAVLVRRELAPRFVEHPLAPTRRGLVEARFELAGARVRALALHLDVFARERRLEQARTAAAILGAEPADLLVIGGDFNYDPDASARLGYAADLAAEAALAAHVTDVAPDCGPTLVGLLRVDRLLAGGRALGGSEARTTPHRTPLGDHAPLVADLRLRTDLAVGVDGDGEGP